MKLTYNDWKLFCGVVGSLVFLFLLFGETLG